MSENQAPPAPPAPGESKPEPSAPQAPPYISAPPARIVALLLVLAVFAACVAAGLGAMGLVGPDEPRYAAVAREMAERGDWITPRLHGEVWLEKPVLYYWAAALACKALGEGERSARLPSVLAALLGLIALAWAAQQTYNEATAYLLLLILPATVAFIGFGRAASPDMLFAAMLTVAMAAASCVAKHNGREGRPRRISMISFGVFLGLATLAKGPAALVLAGGSAGLWAAVSGRWRAAARLLMPDVVLSFAAVALPWYVLVALRNPRFIDEFLLSHNLARFLTPVFQHEQAWWFYAPVLLLGVAPWTLLLLAPLRDAARAPRRAGWRNSPTLFFASWAVFPVLFFTVSRSKLPGYILPAIPAVALLMAWSLARAAQRGEPLARWLAAGLGLSFIALAASAGYWAQRLPAEAGLDAAGAGTAWVAGVTLAGLGIAVLGAMRRTWPALAAAALLVAALVTGIHTTILPRLDRHLSARAVAREAQRAGFSAESLCTYRLHRAWQYGLNFYFARELPPWSPEAGCAGLVFTPRTELHELAQRTTRVELVQAVSERALLVRVE